MEVAEIPGGRHAAGAFCSEVGSQARDGPAEDLGTGSLEWEDTEDAVYTLDGVGEASVAESEDVGTDSEQDMRSRAEAALAGSSTPCLLTYMTSQRPCDSYGCLDEPCSCKMASNR